MLLNRMKELSIRKNKKRNTKISTDKTVLFQIVNEFSTINIRTSGYESRKST